MHSLKDLLKMNYLIYDQIVNKSGLPVESVNQLLSLERHLFEHMTSDEVSSLIDEFQKIPVNLAFDEGITAIFTRISIQLTYMKHFYDMQESSDLTIRKLRMFEMNDYANRIFEDLSFYEHFYRCVHKHLENTPQNDFIYSFFYPNYSQTQQKLVPPISEDDFFYHEECDQLLLENFKQCCETMMDHGTSSSVVEAYLKTFPSFFAPHFNKKLLKYGELQELFKKYGFDMQKERERSLAIYQKSFEFDFHEFIQYQKWMYEIMEASEEVLYSLKSVFYQIQHGTKEDIETASISFFNDIQKEKEILNSCFSSVDELHRFRGYLINTQLGGCRLSFPLFLSFFECDDEFAQNFMPVAFTNRLLNKLDFLETFLRKKEHPEETEDDALWEYINQIEDAQQVFLDFFKGEISLEDFIQDVLEIKNQTEIIPHYMVDRNFVSSLLQILSKDYLKKDKRKKLTSICCYTLYMQGCEEDVFLGYYGDLPFYSYHDSKEYSSSFREEYEEMAKSNICCGVYPYVKKAYKDALYKLLSANDRILLKEHLQLARKKNV